MTRYLIRLSILSCINLISVFANTIPEYILVSGPSGNCGETATSSSAYVKSHDGAGLLGGLTSYTANQDCEITFNAGTGKQVLIQFAFFDLQPPVSSVCLDSLVITELDEVTTAATTTPPTTLTTQVMTEGNATTEANMTTESVTTGTTEVPTTEGTTTEALTTTESQTTTEDQTTTDTTGTGTTGTGTAPSAGTVTDVSSEETVTPTVPPVTPTIPPGVTIICVSPGTAYVSTSSSVGIRFISDGSIQRSGFSLLLTSFHTGTCTASEFSCDTNRCISSALKCDGASHCVDGADETNLQAGCPVKQAEEEEGLSQYAILAIALVSAGVVLTIFTSILLWKYPSGPCKCKGDVEEEPPQQQSTSKGPPAEAKKQKKAVKISVEEKKAAKSEEKPKPKGPSKKKVEPLVATDVEW